MPPKPKFSKEEIINAAYELVESGGASALSARELGKKLNSTSTPIFTFFRSMDELKNEVLKKVQREFSEYISGAIDYTPSFKEYGMRFIRISSEKRNLYDLICQNGNISTKAKSSNEFGKMVSVIVNEVVDMFGISRENAEKLFDRMTVYANGIIHGKKTVSEDEISIQISEICRSLVISYYISENKFDKEKVSRLMSAEMLKPIPKHSNRNQISEQ